MSEKKRKHGASREESGYAKGATAEKQAPETTGKMSSQMEAVYRIMTGKEERTIAEKLADSNRPTWEQYKKDNEDKLNLEGLDQKKMEEYRRELDHEREKILSRGLNHGGGKKKKKKKRKYHDYSSESDDDSRRKHKRSKKRKERRKKKHRKRHSDSERSNTDSDGSDASRRKKHNKKKRKKEKEESDERYRLSNFFTKGSDSED